MTPGWRHSHQGGRALPISRRPKAPLEPVGRSPHCGAREGRGRGRSGACGRIGDPRGARVQPQELAQRARRGDREDALLRRRRAAADVAGRDAPSLTATRRERELPSAEGASCRRGKAAVERHDAASAAARPSRRWEAQARRRWQRRRERRTTTTAPREEATAPATTRRVREPLSTTHRAERASRRRGRAAAERHTAASAAAQPSRR